jgi:hypothetical protein
MTQEQFDVRLKRAAEELFVIPTTDEGWRVRSAHNPSRYYLVSGDGEGLRCGRPDFETHSEDPNWTCKHILAVQDYQTKTGAAHSATDAYALEERAAIQAEASPREASNVQPANGKSQPAQMSIKRSISPDGRIDSISIEFSSIVDDATVDEIKSRALKTLKLQTEIVRSFLGSTRSNAHGNGNSNVWPNGNNNARLNTNAEYE